LQEKTPLAGSSAGAIVSAALGAGVTPLEALQMTKDLADDCRKNGTAGRLGVSGSHLKPVVFSLKASVSTLRVFQALTFICISPYQAALVFVLVTCHRCVDQCAIWSLWIITLFAGCFLLIKPVPIKSMGCHGDISVVVGSTEVLGDSVPA
jgi:hypothetical protein